MYLAIFFTQRITFYAIPMLLASFLVFVCGAWVVRSNPAAVTNRTFGLLSLGACIWLVSMSMLYSTTDDDEATFWGKCVYLGIVYIPAMVYHFCVRLYRRTGDKLILGNYLIGTVFLCMLPTPYLVNGHYSYFWGLYPKAGFCTLSSWSIFLVVMAGLHCVNSICIRNDWRDGSTARLPRNIFWAFVVGLGLLSTLYPVMDSTLYPIGYLLLMLLDEHRQLRIRKTSLVGYFDHLKAKGADHC